MKTELKVNLADLRICDDVRSFLLICHCVMPELPCQWLARELATYIGLGGIIYRV